MKRTVEYRPRDPKAGFTAEELKEILEGYGDSAIVFAQVNQRWTKPGGPITKIIIELGE